jgi:hypothetical protein
MHKTHTRHTDSDLMDMRQPGGKRSTETQSDVQYCVRHEEYSRDDRSKSNLKGAKVFYASTLDLQRISPLTPFTSHDLPT